MFKNTDRIGRSAHLDLALKWFLRYIGPNVLITAQHFNVYAHGRRLCSVWFWHGSTAISYPQCNSTFICMGAICIDVASSHKLFTYMPLELLAKMSWAVTIKLFACRSWTLFAQMSWAVIWNTAESLMVSQDSRMNCKVQVNEMPLILWTLECISTKGWYETHHSHLCLKSTNGGFSVGFWDIQWVIW